MQVSDHLGFRFQAQLQSATQAAGGGVYFGTGGAGAGVTTYSSMTQFVLGWRGISQAESNRTATSRYHYQKPRCVYIGTLTVKPLPFNGE